MLNVRKDYLLIMLNLIAIKLQSNYNSIFFISSSGFRSTFVSRGQGQSTLTATGCAETQEKSMLKPHSYAGPLTHEGEIQSEKLKGHVTGNNSNNPIHGRDEKSAVPLDPNNEADHTIHQVSDI